MVNNTPRACNANPLRIGVYMNINFTKFIKSIFISTIIVAIIGSSYIYINYARIDKSIIDAELAERNKITISDNNIEVIGNNFSHILKLRKEFARRHNFKGIYINDHLLKLNDSKVKLYYTIDDENIIVKSDYLIKPSLNKLKLCFGDKSFEYDLALKYRYDFSDNNIENTYWYQNPTNWAAISDKGMTLMPSERKKANTLGFRRAFQNNVKIEAEVIPEGFPLNVSMFMDLGTSVFFGVGDDRSIQIIQSKYIGKTKTEKIVKRSYLPFQKNELYKISVENTNNSYEISIDKDGSNQLKLLYNDSTSEQNIKETYKNVGFAVWKNSKGLIVKSVTISSKDAM